MGFFSDLKEDLSQAVNELIPEESLETEDEELKKEDTAISLDEMLANIDSIKLPDSFGEEGSLKLDDEKTEENGEEEININEATDLGLENSAALDESVPGALKDSNTIEDSNKLEYESIKDNANDIYLTENEETSKDFEGISLDAVKTVEEAINYANAADSIDDDVNEMQALLDGKQEDLTDGTNNADENIVNEITSLLDKGDGFNFDDIKSGTDMEKYSTENITDVTEKTIVTQEETIGDSLKNPQTDEDNKGVMTSMDNKDERIAVDETAIITAGMLISGDIFSEGSLEIVGSVVGNIDIYGKLSITGKIEGDSRASEVFADGAKISGKIESDGAVKIGASTVIVGDIFATSAVIAGAVKGDIDVKGPVVLDTSAIVMGNVKSKAIQINNGAVIEGNCSQCYADVNPTSFFEDYKFESKKKN